MTLLTSRPRAGGRAGRRGPRSAAVLRRGRATRQVSWSSAFDRRRHAVEPADQDDLAVELVDLGAGAAAEALERRAAERHLQVVAAAQDVATPLPVLGARDAGEAGRGVHLLALRPGALLELGGRVAGHARGIDGVADVHQQLAALPRHDVGPRHRLEAGGAQVGGDRLGGRVDAVGHPPEVEDAGRRVALLHDHPGLQVGRGQHHADPVRRLEQPQDGRLVGDAVLRRHHHRLDGSVRRDVVEGGRGLVALHAEQHHGVGVPLGLGSAADGGHRHRVAALRAVQHQPVAADRRQVGSPSDERDVHAGQVQVGADHASDGAGAVDDVPHPLRPALARTAPGAGTRRSATPRRPSVPCPSAGRRRRCRAPGARDPAGVPLRRLAVVLDEARLEALAAAGAAGGIVLWLFGHAQNATRARSDANFGTRARVRRLGP